MQAADVPVGATDLEVIRTVEQLLEQRADLAARQVRTQAQVWAATAEGELAVWFARDIEAMGIAVLAFIAVGRGIPDRDPITGADGPGR